MLVNTNCQQQVLSKETEKSNPETKSCCPAKVQGCPKESPECADRICALKFLPNPCPRCGSGPEARDGNYCMGKLPDGTRCNLRIERAE